MADFVTLTCPSCGGKLEITQDIERFTCAHCGQEHVVKRSGDVVSLSPVIDALHKVGAGVDKTAAELAIVRLQKEIKALQENRASLLSLNPRPLLRKRQTAWGIFRVIFGCSFIGLALLVWGYNNELVSIFYGWPLFVGGILVFIIGLRNLIVGPNTEEIENWERTTGSQLKSFDDQIATKEKELKHHRDIVAL